jgi:hypothetical protein
VLKGKRKSKAKSSIIKDKTLLELHY